MRRWIPHVTLISLLAVAATAGAINVGTDILVPAAGRGAGSGDSMWVTDLYIFNPGTAAVTVTVYWLVRDQANPDPTSEVFDIEPGATLVLDDVILSTFSQVTAGGAFRVMADDTVAVNSRIYNLQDATTFGQGFEGVPVGDAIAAGSSTDVVGLSHDASFRSNLVLIDASGSGSTVNLSLRDVDGNEVATATYDLEAWEPLLFSAAYLDSELEIASATLHAEVTAGAVIVAGSKVDFGSGDPTTLEAWIAGGGAASADGTYQISVYDSEEYAAGGNLVIANGEVTEIIGTYINWDKDDDSDGEPDCPWIFGWGGIFDEPFPVADFAAGVTWTESFPDSGQMTWNLMFTVANNMALTGTLDAVGADFTGDEVGCVGTFPTLTFYGGKAE